MNQQKKKKHIFLKRREGAWHISSWNTEGSSWKQAKQVALHDKGRDGRPIFETTSLDTIAKESFRLHNFIYFSVSINVRQNCEFCLGFFLFFSILLSHTCNFPLGDAHFHCKSNIYLSFSSHFIGRVFAWKRYTRYRIYFYLLVCLLVYWDSLTLYLL